MEDATTPTEESMMLPVQLAIPLALMVGAVIAAKTVPQAVHREPAPHGPVHLLDDCHRAWTPCTAVRPGRAARRCWCSTQEPPL